MFAFDKPTLISITGPSASGKSFIHDRLITPTPDGGPALCHKIRSVTSRPMRAGEVNGEDYTFLSAPEIAQMHEEGKLIEHNVFLGNHYGVTSAEFVSKVLSRSMKTPVIILDPNGVKTFEPICRQYNVDLLKLYVFSPSLVINQRLIMRCDDDMKKAVTPDDEAQVLEAHQLRVKNAERERYWIHDNTWDGIIDGTEYTRALDSIHRAVMWKNRKNETPTPFNGL